MIPFFFCNKHILFVNRIKRSWEENEEIEKIGCKYGVVLV